MLRYIAVFQVLSENHIGGEGAATVCQMLMENRIIRSLDLSGKLGVVRVITLLNTQRPARNGLHFANDIFKCIFWLVFFFWFFFCYFQSNFKFVHKCPIDLIMDLKLIDRRRQWRNPIQLSQNRFILANVNKTKTCAYFTEYTSVLVDKINYF